MTTPPLWRRRWPRLDADGEKGGQAGAHETGGHQAQTESSATVSRLLAGRTRCAHMDVWSGDSLTLGLDSQKARNHASSPLNTTPPLRGGFGCLRPSLTCTYHGRPRRGDWACVVDLLGGKSRERVKLGLFGSSILAVWGWVGSCLGRGGKMLIWQGFMPRCRIRLGQLRLAAQGFPPARARPSSNRRRGFSPALRAPVL